MEWPAGLVSPINIPAWRGFPLRERLTERFGAAPVRVHNDAICLTAGEHWRGAGRGTRNMLGMVVSTGVGGGLILDGDLVQGASGNAGHIGHVPVYPDDGPVCGCGAVGCLEAVARGPALAAWAQSQGWRPGQPDATAKDLAADGAAGHPVGLAAMRRAGHGARHRDRDRHQPVRPGGGGHRRRPVPGRVAAVRPARAGAPGAHPAGVRPPGPGRARGPGPERGPDRRRRPGAGRRDCGYWRLTAPARRAA